MKKNIVLVLISIGLGVIFTFFFLNKENIYAKEEYVVYAFQTGAYSSYDSAKESNNSLSSIIVSEDSLYKVYSAIYKDIDLVNKMISYFESKGISVYLKMLKVDKNFYNSLDKYEEVIKQVDDTRIYDGINQSILNLYLESIG